MKQSKDESMADMSKVSSERVPMSEKKGEPSGSGVARGIGPMGIDMCQGEAPSMSGYSHSAGADVMEGGLQNPTGIGMGDGGPTIDEMGSSNPGHPL